tara:strand:+ start:125 stop:886 length:762 start_codon:yes stop_codon:yes gene_type:complete
VKFFLFDVFLVPSDSMKDSLHAEDYIVVNKINYGIKLKKKVDEYPILDFFFENNDSIKNFDTDYQLIQFKNFERGDIVVFKSVIHKKERLVKRIIGLPNDTILIESSKVFINSNELLENENYCYNYVFKSEKFTKLIKTISNREYKLLNKSKKKEIRKVISKKHTINNWTIDYFGPLVIPKKGTKIKVDSLSLKLYENIINKEKNINEIIGKEYTFKRNYYFLIGDNRHNSIDSRYFGFVPENFIIGKVFLKI